MPNDMCTFDLTTRMERGDAGYIANEGEGDMNNGELTLVPNSPTTSSCKQCPPWGRATLF